VEADFAERAVGVEFDPSIAIRLVHLVVAVPGELDIIRALSPLDTAGDAAEGELARASAGRRSKTLCSLVHRDKPRRGCVCGHRSATQVSAGAPRRSNVPTKKSNARFRTFLKRLRRS